MKTVTADVIVTKAEAYVTPDGQGVGTAWVTAESFNSNNAVNKLTFLSWPKEDTPRVGQVLTVTIEAKDRKELR